MKVITWNSQGAKEGSILDLIKKEEPDVLVVQEVGNLEKYVKDEKWNFEEAVRLTDGIVPEGYYGWWCPWAKDQSGGGNIRCSMAMFWKTDLNSANGAPMIIGSNDAEKRMVMRKLLDGKQIYNIHAGGMDYLKEVASLPGNLDKYIILGDFNQEAGGIKDALSAKGVFVGNMNVVSTKDPDYTRPASKKVIDYAIANLKDGKAELCRRFDPSDHKSVLVSF